MWYEWYNWIFSMSRGIELCHEVKEDWRKGKNYKWQFQTHYLDVCRSGIESILEVLGKHLTSIKKVKGTDAFRMVCIKSFPVRKRSPDLNWRSGLENKDKCHGRHLEREERFPVTPSYTWEDFRFWSKICWIINQIFWLESPIFFNYMNFLGALTIDLSKSAIVRERE